jgi:hypothetical protein
VEVPYSKNNNTAVVLQQRRRALVAIGRPKGRSFWTSDLDPCPCPYRPRWSLTSCAIRGAKTRIIGRLKAANARRALFFCAFVGMPLANNIPGISRSKNSAPRSWWLVVGGRAQRLQAASGSPAARAGGAEAHPTPALDFFRATSAGERLLVSTVTLCGAKPNSLTPLDPVVLTLLKITMHM